MILLDGKKTAAIIKNEIAHRVQIIKNQGEKPPHLAAILVGEDGASRTYVANKVKACKRVGFKSSLIHLSEYTTQDELLTEIDKLNNDNEIDGFIVQLPLPKHIDKQKVLLAVNPEKDIDGFHPENFGRMALEIPSFLPATPYGILELIKRYNINTQGKEVVVIGRSNIVGKPISILLSQKKWNATVTLAHSRTENLEKLTKKADIIIAAMGQPNFLKVNMVKDGVVIIDVGITRLPDSSSPKGYRIVGDTDFNTLQHKASFITPVPGGIGPMTIAMLMKNTLISKELKLSKKTKQHYGETT